MSRERATGQAGRWIGLALLANLAGCNDPAIDLGTPPPVTLSEQHVVVPLGQGRDALRNAVATLRGTGDTDAIRAQVDVADMRRAATIRATLIGLGLQPAKIEVASRGDDVVVLSRTQARVESCALSTTPSADGGIGRSTLSVGECVQANALASMLADPADLATPVRLSPADATRQVLAVQSYRQGATTAATSATAGAAGASAGAGAGADQSGQAGGSGAGATAGAANPLLSGAALPAASTPSAP